MIAYMSFGRLIRVTTKESGEQGPRSVTYLVAEENSERAIKIIRAAVAAPEDEIEAVGRASEQLLSALGVARGQFVRA